MKKIFLIFAIGIALTGNAFADTWDIYGEADCVDYKTDPIEGTTCWHVGQWVTYNATATVNSSVSISIIRTPQWVNAPNTHFQQTCSGSGCDYAVMTTATLGNGIAFAQSSSDTRSLATGASTGLQYISYQAITTGLVCNPPVGWNCMIGTSDTISPITITAAASVNLNITGFLDKLLRLFI